LKEFTARASLAALNLQQLGVRGRALAEAARVRLDHPGSWSDQRQVHASQFLRSELAMQPVEHRNRQDREPAHIGIEPIEHPARPLRVAQRQRRRQRRVRAGDRAVVVSERFVVGVVERVGGPEAEVDVHRLETAEVDHGLEHLTPEAPVHGGISKVILEARRRDSAEPATDAATLRQLERGRREQQHL